MSYKDIIEVDLQQVPDPHLQPGWSATPKGYSRAEIHQWARQLRQVQAMSRDQGLTHEDFQSMAASADPSQREIARTYEKFYSSTDQVKLDWDGRSYTIVNGNHRIVAAKQEGLRHLPAQVSTRERADLERLRSDGDRLAGGERPSATRPAPLWERREAEARTSRGERVR